MKLAILVLSDPKSGADEALGRVFNALALAHESQQSGDEVELVFEGAGTRWPEQLAQLTHPANGLYNAVRDRVKGASCACSEVFGARTSAERAGIALLRDNPLPGT
ncbi:MAG TPA: hypothetical protein VGD81_18860, partial [Opitutaceae bacterium]